MDENEQRYFKLHYVNVVKGSNHRSRIEENKCIIMYKLLNLLKVNINITI